MGRRRPSNEKDRPVPAVSVSYRRLLGYMRPYWPRLVLALIGLVLASLVGLVFPLVIRDLLDSVLDAGSQAQLDQLALGLLGVFALQSVFRFVQGYQLGYVGERVVLDLREQLFSRLTRHSLGFYNNRRTGELVSRVSSDATRLRNVVTSDLTSALSQVITMIGSLVLMVAINWRLMSFIVVIVPVIVAFGTVFGLWLRRISSEMQDAIADSMVVVEESISGIRVVKSFAREDYENLRFVTTQHSIFRIARRLLVVRNTFGPLMAFIGFGSLAGFLWFGGREVLAGRLSVGELVAFMFYGVNVAASVTSFVSLYASIQEAIGATKRIFEIIDLPPGVADAPDAESMPTMTGRVQFENVSFAYVPDTPVLQDINLTIEPGESLALVGPSGAGKTTLFNLIPRFYDPVEGCVAIDGVDLRTVTQRSLRAQIGLVPQDTLLFGGSVRDNIRYGRLDASQDDIVAAAQAANAHEFIIALPDGYETLVGERGVKLSGGQRQRVAIARAILKDPRILLLDEATSSLDSESEGLVQEALDRLMVGRTTVIIAHRLSTIRAVDRIAVLEAGRIVELGTHEELLASGGLYARLYNMQFREQIHDTKTSTDLVGTSG